MGSRSWQPRFEQERAAKLYPSPVFAPLKGDRHFHGMPRLLDGLARITSFRKRWPSWTWQSVYWRSRQSLMICSEGSPIGQYSVYRESVFRQFLAAAFGRRDPFFFFAFDKVNSSKFLPPTVRNVRRRSFAPSSAREVDVVDNF